MTTSISMVLLASAALSACSGVSVRGRTVIAPLAPPTAQVTGAGRAVVVGGVGDADDGGSTGSGSSGAASSPSPSSSSSSSSSFGVAPGSSAVLGASAAVVDSDAAASHGAAAPARLTVSPEVMAARASTGCFVADRRPHDRTPPSDGPIDPWRAVDHGRPRVLPHSSTPWIDRGDVACDAAHDHCLRDCTWLVSTDTGAQSWLPEVRERDATADGWEDVNSDLAFVAFRSVPATRDNLDVGVTALASAEAPRPGSAWTYGTVEAIDWAEGTVRLRGHRHAYPLAFTRVAVLRYSGSSVEPLR